MFFSLPFGVAYYNRSNLISIEITKTSSPYEDYTIGQNFYNVSNDSSQWVHFEYSFESTTKLIRFFRNGTLIWSYTLPGEIAKGYNLCGFNQDYINLQELLVIQKCMHTANFTPAIEEYVWIDKDQEYKDKEEILYGYK